MPVDSSHKTQESFAPTSLSWAHPLVQEWFVGKFGTPTEPQEQGWPHILAGKTTLISAPTGSGKTLAAFLACIDKLVCQAVENKLGDKTEVLYVSPLKALSNDVQKNLEVPLAEISALAKSHGIEMAEIRTAVRTGDTLMQERLSMLKRPPHILVTTPESLYILVTAGKSRQMLASVQTVIVDEIHAVADDKRGAHLSLSLERLTALVHHPLTRIGLSATQKPIELVAEFLRGSSEEPAIVQIGHKRKMDIQIEVPPSPLGAVATNEMWDEIYDRIAALALEHKSTLVFVNTRRLAERLALHLAERLGEDQVACHHGSLSRKLRHSAEHKLKTGELRLLVATASLELGIDIGDVELVCQIGSPRAIAVALQRIGRSGHWRGAIPKGRLFATTRDEVIECAACVHAIKQGELDKIIMPEAPLDVLAQQIVACSATNEWQEDELFRLVTSAHPYRQLHRQSFDAILQMLTDGFQGRKVQFGSYLHRDRINSRVKGKRGAALAAITNGGAIPETALFAVVVEPDGKNIGTLDEDFAIESNRGDIFLLGNTSWRIKRVESFSGRVLVEDAHGAPPTVPFWRGEAPSRTSELSNYVARVREHVSNMLVEISLIEMWQDLPEVKRAVNWLQEECGLSESAGEQVIEYILAGRAILGDVPTQKTIIAERFFDESGGMQLVIHAPFGGRINKAWGLALRKRFCVGFNLELQAAATDDGINIALSDQHSFPLADVFLFLNQATVKEVLEQAALVSPIFTSRWRWDTTRSLSILRFSGGKKVPPQIQRMRAEDLLACVFPQAAACQDNIEGDIEIPSHPLVDEVMKDVFQEAMDLEGLKSVLNDIATGAIKIIAIDTPTPSVFSQEILNANPYAFLDDAPLEERRARAVEMRRMLPQNILEEFGQLDPDAIDQVISEAFPDIRDTDELHDLLSTLIAMPTDLTDFSIGNFGSWHQLIQGNWNDLFAKLKTAGRVAQATINDHNYWLTAETNKAFSTIFPGASFDSIIPDFASPFASREEAVSAMLKGWLMHLGPVTANELALLLSLPLADVELGLLKLESAGTILRGQFRFQRANRVARATNESQVESGSESNIEWCERRLLARIHKLTVGTLRRSIEPVTAAQFFVWLTQWQHVAKNTQVNQERGLLEVIKQLQGFEAPANAWEQSILKHRVSSYSRFDLDRLSLTGAIGWGRLSPHPATIKQTIADQTKNDTRNNFRIEQLDTVPDKRRRVIPSSNAPIAFFVRDDCHWMVHKKRQDELENIDSISHAAKLIFKFIKKHGASFFPDIVRATKLLKAEIENGLWELVAAGAVTADDFDNLRSLIDSKRRYGLGPRHSGGRWSLIFCHEEEEAANRWQVAEAASWMLLNRYGVVFRDLLARETCVPSWRELLTAFRRLEAQGQVRGGRFVDGFLGEQFALPFAVESLRSMRNNPTVAQAASQETITISAADPLNLVGILIPGERISPLSSKSITITGGTVVTHF
jgi:ATP-dependent Lhr-like helicase